MSDISAHAVGSPKMHTQNIRHVSHLNLPGAGQVEVRGDYAYIAHMKYPFGITIVDVSDRKNPQIASQIMLEDERTHTHKVRPFGDDLICTNV